jgi:hypothetical protein
MVFRLGADWLFNRILGYRTLPKTQLQLPIPEPNLVVPEFDYNVVTARADIYGYGQTSVGSRGALSPYTA